MVMMLQYKDVILESNHTDAITQRKLRMLLHQDPPHYTAEQVLVDVLLPFLPAVPCVAGAATVPL